MNFKWMVGVMAVLVSFAVFGKDDSSKEPAVTVVTDPVAFKAVTAYLEKQMSTGGRYEFIKQDEHKRIDADLQKIQALLEKQAGGATLSQSETAAQMTAQNEANAIFSKRDGERVVCESVTPIGSHLPKNTCVTFAEQQRRHQNSADYLRLQQNRANKPGNGGG